MSIRMPKLALVAASALCVAALGFAAAITDATAQERVRWKMQSAFGSQLPHLGASGVRFSKDIGRMSGGRLEVKFFEPGALIPPLIYQAINVTEQQFVTPMVLGRTLTLNPFAVVLALVFWVWLWGPLGGFIAIPALLVCYAVMRNIFPGVGWAESD